MELALLQHLTLLLGHPIFTLSILLFTLLAAGGLGSWAERRASAADRLPRVAAVAASSTRSRCRALVPRAAAAGAAPRASRSRSLLVAPLGFADGHAFPAGAARDGQRPVPGATFYWGLNGLFSVVGSMATMVTAVIFGFTWAMLGGAFFYLVAALSSRVLRAHPRGA